MRAMLAAGLAFAMLAGASASAQNYPVKQIRFVIGFPPGGATDVVARIISERLLTSMRQPVIVDNRAGAASNIAAELVAVSPKDGYTIFLGTVSLAINRTLYRNLKYDALKDFGAVSQVTSTPFLLVTHPALPATNVKAFIALAKSKPGELNYASAGSGSGAHLFAEMFRSMTGMKIVHVPYKGAAAATTSILSGETAFMFDNIVTTLPLARAGKLRALGVTTLTRASAAPEIPTVAEAGVPGYDANAWFGVFVPAGTPPGIVNRLHTEIAAIVRLPDVRERFLALGGEPVGSTPEEFAAFFRNEVAKWAKVVKESGAQID